MGDALGDDVTGRVAFAQEGEILGEFFDAFQVGGQRGVTKWPHTASVYGNDGFCLS